MNPAMLYWFASNVMLSNADINFAKVLILHDLLFLFKTSWFYNYNQEFLG